MAMAGVVIAFLSTFNEFGLGSALVQTRDLEDERVGAVYGAMLLMGVALSALLALTAPWIAAFFNEPRLQAVISVAGIQFIVSAATIVPESLLRRDMTFKPLALAEMVGAIAASLSTLGLALAHYGVWSLVIGNLFGAMLRMVILIASNPRRIGPNLRLSGATGLLSYGGYLTAARFVAYFMSQSDVLIGAKLLGKDALGLYTVALHLASLPMEKAMSTVNQVAFSAIARLQDQQQAMQAGLTKAIRLLAYLTLPPIFGLACLAPEFIALVLGAKWTDASVPLQIVALAIPLRMLNSLFFTAVNGLGRADMGFKNTLTGAAVLPACFLIGVQWGVIGLATGWLIGAPLVFLLNFKRNAEVIGFTGKQVFSAVSLPLTASLLMMLSIVGLRFVMPMQSASWLYFGLLIATGGITYSLAAVLIDPQLRQEIALLPWIRRLASWGKSNQSR